MTYTIHFNDTTGDIVDVGYYCSLSCMYARLAIEEILAEDLGTFPDNYQSGISGEIKTENINLSYGAWPGGSETDYDVCCETCLSVMWEGIKNEK